MKPKTREKWKRIIRPYLLLSLLPMAVYVPTTWFAVRFGTWPPRLSLPDILLHLIPVTVWCVFIIIWLIRRMQILRFSKPYRHWLNPLGIGLLSCMCALPFVAYLWAFWSVPVRLNTVADISGIKPARYYLIQEARLDTTQAAATFRAYHNKRGKRNAVTIFLVAPVLDGSAPQPVNYLWIGENRDMHPVPERDDLPILEYRDQCLRAFKQPAPRYTYYERIYNSNSSYHAAIAEAGYIAPAGTVILEGNRDPFARRELGLLGYTLFLWLLAGVVLTNTVLSNEYNPNPW